ncbi:MAG: hypothetical protein ACLFWF_06510 [Alphaproteobacteria bacterium]
MSKDDEKRPDDVKSRRELLAATAKLSAFLGAVGVAGTGLAGAAAAQKDDATTPSDSKVREGVGGGPHTEAVSPSDLRGKRILPAVQRRELKGVLRDAMRSGNTQAALKRHPKLKLNRRQEAALKRMSRQDWAALRRLEAKLAPLEELAAGDTGYVFW